MDPAVTVKRASCGEASSHFTSRPRVRHRGRPQNRRRTCGIGMRLYDSRRHAQPGACSPDGPLDFTMVMSSRGTERRAGRARRGAQISTGSTADLGAKPGEAVGEAVVDTIRPSRQAAGEWAKWTSSPTPPTRTLPQVSRRWRTPWPEVEALGYTFIALGRWGSRSSALKIRCTEAHARHSSSTTRSITTRKRRAGRGA